MTLPYILYAALSAIAGFALGWWARKWPYKTERESIYGTVGGNCEPHTSFPVQKAPTKMEVVMGENQRLQASLSEQTVAANRLGERVRELEGELAKWPKRENGRFSRKVVEA